MQPNDPVSALKLYWRGLYDCTVLHKNYKHLQTLHPSPRARLQIYSLALNLRLWSKPHYRSGTFQHDLVKNLRNVAVPGTGVPLSLFCFSRLGTLVFLWILYPLLVAIGTLSAVGRVRFAQEFPVRLLEPKEWITYWRLNCALASYHAMLSSDEGYALEDKFSFLAACEREDIPASPWLTLPKIIVKHRNEEGGLGLQLFDNATAGGDWIIQQALSNAPAIAELLPPEAPLSTLRLVSSSAGFRHKSPKTSSTDADIRVLSACWRAGLAGASTDHKSVLFDVDLADGKIKGGTSNRHWYQLGPREAFRCPWRSEGHTITAHPDSGTPIRGAVVPDIRGICELVHKAHLRLCPGVPIVGWDVALTAEAGMCLLEANLSCNFFRATFDEAGYFEFVESVITHLE